MLFQLKPAFPVFTNPHYNHPTKLVTNLQHKKVRAKDETRRNESRVSLSTLDLTILYKTVISKTTGFLLWCLHLTTPMALPLPLHISEARIPLELLH